MDFLRNEPVSIAAAFRAVLAAAVGLGLFNLTTEQMSMLVVAVEAVLAVLVRAVVTPTNKIT